MGAFRLQLFTAREKRAAAILGIAGVLLVASAVAMWRPALPRRAAPAAAAPTPTLQRYASFWFTSPNTAFALASLQPMQAGNLGTREDLFRTTDSATTWKRLPMPGGFTGLTGGFAYLQPVSNSGLVLGIASTSDIVFAYWLSTDGGATWHAINTPTPVNRQSTLQALDARTFVEVSRPLTSTGPGGLPVGLAWTHDGGASWEQVLQLDAEHPAAGALDISRPYAAPTFVDDRHGWALTNLPTRPGADVAPRAGPPNVVRTDDGGRTWTGAALPDSSLSESYSGPVFPGGGRHGYVMGYSPSGLLIYESVDSGASWLEPYAANVNWFAAAPDRWLANDGVDVLTSRDWGRTWAHVSPRLPPGSVPLGLLQLSGAMVWSTPLGRGPAELLRSSDGGRSWALARWPGA